MGECFSAEYRQCYYCRLLADSVTHRNVVSWQIWMRMNQQAWWGRDIWGMAPNGWAVWQQKRTTSNAHFDRVFPTNDFGHECSVCDRLWFMVINKHVDVLQQHFNDELITEFHVCIACKQSLSHGNLPALSKTIRITSIRSSQWMFDLTKTSTFAIEKLMRHRECCRWLSNLPKPTIISGVPTI